MAYMIGTSVMFVVVNTPYKKLYFQFNIPFCVWKIKQLHRNNMFRFCSVSPVQYAIILAFFKDIVKFILYFGKCVTIKPTNTDLNVIHSCGLQERLGLTDNLKQFLCRCEQVQLTTLCRKTDYHWLIYWQVAHTDIIIKTSVGFIAHLFNMSSLYCYLFSASGVLLGSMV
jgi:hypothetical protein